MVCMITYDLNATGQRYEEVIQAIKKCSTGKWCSYWKSSYLIQTAKSPQAITDMITPFLDGNDRLFVVEVKRNFQGWLSPKQWSYVHNMFDTDIAS